MTGIAYEDFLDLGYEPGDDELICTFHVEPADGIDREAAAGRVASESSNGTWTELQVPGEVTDLSATAFDIDGDRLHVAYPAALFEPGNMAQVLSCIAGNILGMKAVDRIRLLDCDWPASIAADYPGPLYGTAVREAIFEAGDRPITATVPKPKVGLTADQHAHVGHEAWLGGVDLLKDDENLTDQAFNPFADRLTESLARRDDAEDATGEPKSYLVNVTAETETMLDRIDDVAAQGGEYVMVDIVTSGWSALQTVRERCERHGLAIHAHRAMHAAFDRYENHGVSMRCLAQFARLCGVDHIHTGTAGLGKMENEDTIGINDWLYADLHGVNDVLPVASGGLHPGVVPELLNRIGQNVCIQAGGGIHGHPDGTRAGARALRASIDAATDGMPLEAAAEQNEALAKAVETWGTEAPR